MAIELDNGPPAQSPAASLKGPLAVAMSCFFVWGLAYGLLDVLNKHFQETLHVGKAQSSWLQMAYFGAYLSMSLPVGLLLEARGYKFVLVRGLVVTSLGALLFLPSAQMSSFPYFVGSMFVMATGLCCLETAADTYVNALGPPERAPQRLNLAQSINAFGVFLGPLIGGSLFFNPVATQALGGEQRAVQLTYLVIAAVVALFAVTVHRAQLPEIEAKNDSSGSKATENSVLWSQKHFVFGVTTQALYVGAQVGIGAYFLNLAVDTWHGLTSQNAAFLLSLATLAYLLGRFTTTALLLRVLPRTILGVYGSINVLLCVVTAIGLEKVSTVALMAVFFFMGTMFATIFSLGVRNLGASTKRGASVMVMAIGGGALFPYPMGRIAEAYGTHTAFVLPAISFALVALYGWKLAGLDD